MRFQIEIMTKNSIFSTIYYQKSPPGGSRTKNYNQCSQSCMGEYGFDFLVKTPGHYQVAKLSNLKHKFKICAVLRRTGPRKNERSENEYLII